ncbi:MAG: TatD family hydrolase [Longimicrobiales bacterium]|nr:TatD family hydrolase [Longimicrobiales bacterium]
MLVDSHCHLSDARFDTDRPEVLLRSGRAGVEKILVIASDRADAMRVESLLDETQEGAGAPKLWGTAGVHPHEAETAAQGDLDAIRELASRHPRIVAVGETGLDFFYDHSPRSLQETLFRDHLAMAEELSLPIVVHSRSADDLTGRILKEWGGRVRGVLHCFTGGDGLLAAALSVGWMVSFTGIITFKKYDAQSLVRSVPRELLMVETDAPYLAPVPYRGGRNEPSFVARVAESLAAIRGEDLEEVEGYTSENAIRFFDLTP